MGKRFDTYALTPKDYFCKGRISKPKQIGPFHKTGGWARFPDGRSVKTIYVVNNGIVIGLGTCSPLFGRVLFNQQIKSAPFLERIFSIILPYKAAVVLGFHSQWIAILNLSSTEHYDDINYYATIDGKNFDDLFNR